MRPRVATNSKLSSGGTPVSYEVTRSESCPTVCSAWFGPLAPPLGARRIILKVGLVPPRVRKQLDPVDGPAEHGPVPMEQLVQPVRRFVQRVVRHRRLVLARATD